MYTEKSFESNLLSGAISDFENLALELFQYQSKYCTVYSTYLDNLGIVRDKVRNLNDIPFLPIRFFKSHKIQSELWPETRVFESSGTTGLSTSKHLLHSDSFYQYHSLRLFEQYFGDIKNYHLFALLPSYLERENSSLIFMINHFINESKSSYSGFYLNDFERLSKDLTAAKKDKRKIILWGVTYALLDMVEEMPINLFGHIILETGGMKGRRKEMIRMELHEKLKQGFKVNHVYSEYGMTELLSQAYAMGDGIFKTPDSMRVILRDLYDPFNFDLSRKTGGINIIDLANHKTCAFIETEDIGRSYEYGFEVLGRFDNSDIRGCNLMIS